MEFEKKITLENYPRKRTATNILVIGTASSGKCHHPWDDLKPCVCGTSKRPLLMYSKDELFYCGGPTHSVFAICSTCGLHTAQGEISDVISEWNNNHISN